MLTSSFSTIQDPCHAMATRKVILSQMFTSTERTVSTSSLVSGIGVLTGSCSTGADLHQAMAFLKDAILSDILITMLRMT